MISMVLLSAFMTQAAVGGSVEVLTYEQAIKEAHEKNLDLKAAQARLDQAHEISRKAWAGYLPTLVASGAYTRNQYESSISLPTGYWVRTLDPNTPAGVLQSMNGPPGDPTRPPSTPPDVSNPPGNPSQDVIFPSGFETAVIQPKNQLVGQIQLTQALLVPPLWAAISTSYTAEKVAVLTVDSVQREVLFAVAQLYYGAVGLKQALAAQQWLLDTTKAHEHDAGTRVKAGAMPRISLIRAEIDRARAEQDLQRSQNALASAKIALGTMLQRQGEFDVEQPTEPTVVADEKALEEAALKDRPDVAAARASIDLAGGQKTGTWLQYLPSIFGNAVYKYANFAGFSNTNTSWALTVALVDVVGRRPA